MRIFHGSMNTVILQNDSSNPGCPRGFLIAIYYYIEMSYGICRRPETAPTPPRDFFNRNNLDPAREDR